MAKQDEYVRYTIRVPEGLYGRIQMAAEASGRSVNAEIIATFEEKYPPPLPLGTIEFLRSILARTPNMPETDRRILQCMLDELNGQDPTKAEKAARMFIEGFIEAARADPPAHFYKSGDSDAPGLRRSEDLSAGSGDGDGSGRG